MQNDCTVMNYGKFYEWLQTYSYFQKVAIAIYVGLKIKAS